MEPKHVITQVVGTAVAVLLVRWGWKEFRSDWHDHRRLPLVTGPYMGGRTVFVTLAALAALVPILIGIFYFELVPKRNGAAFAAMLAWVSLGFVFVLLGATTRQARLSAKGWITLVGDGAVRIDADGASATLKLGPGSATLRFIDSGVGPQYVQLDLDDGTSRAHVWGMVGLRDLKLVSPERLAHAQGLMAATSMGPLVRRLAPYLAKV
jgi:hypothetical protein